MNAGSSSGSSSGSFSAPQAPPSRDNDGWREVPGRPPIPGVKATSSSSASSTSGAFPAANPFMNQPASPAKDRDDNWNFVPLDKGQGSAVRAPQSDTGSMPAAPWPAAGRSPQSQSQSLPPLNPQGQPGEWPRRAVEPKSDALLGEGSSGSIRLDRLAFDIANQDAPASQAADFSNFSSAVAAKFNANSPPSGGSAQTPPFAPPMPGPAADSQPGQAGPQGAAPGMPPFAQPQSPFNQGFLSSSASSNSSTQPPFPFGQWPQRSFGERFNKPPAVEPGFVEEIGLDDFAEPHEVLEAQTEVEEPAPKEEQKLETLSADVDRKSVV